MGFSRVEHALLYRFNGAIRMIRVKETGLASDVRKALNELARLVESSRVFTSDTVKVRRRTIGTTLEGTKKAKAEPGEGMKFKGEYISGQAYERDDVVVVRGGSTAGTYIAYQDVPASAPAPQDPPVDPTQGIYWIQIAPGYTIGQWT